MFYLKGRYETSKFKISKKFFHSGLAFLRSMREFFVDEQDNLGVFKVNQNLFLSRLHQIVFSTVIF